MDGPPRPLTRVFIEYDVTVTGLPTYSSAMWYLFHEHELVILFLILEHHPAQTPSIFPRSIIENSQLVVLEDSSQSVVL